MKSVVQRSEVWDTVIIGAGPAGLTAAAYLGRFKRSVVVLHTHESRARWIPTSHNTPGFPSGVGGGELLSRLCSQAHEYGAQTTAARVREVRSGRNVFEVEADQQVYRARFVILATGVLDKLPPLPGIEDAVRRGLVRICPICDAYEARNSSIAVLSDGEHGIREAEFLLTYSRHISLVHIGAALGKRELERLSQQGIGLMTANKQELSIDHGGMMLRTPGEATRFDVWYVALGCAPRTTLLANLNPALDESGALRVSAHQETSVAGLYAAGDVVRGLNQIIVAEAEGAIAATDIHNKLRAR